MSKIIKMLLAPFAVFSLALGVGLTASKVAEGVSAAPSGAITNYTSITPGDYYIGATTSSTDYYLSVDGSTLGTSIAGTSVTSTTSATIFTFAGSGSSWTIKFKNTANYLGLKKSKDNGKVQVLSSSQTLTASNKDTLIALRNGSSSTLSKNSSGLQFGNYQNTQPGIWLVPAIDLTYYTVSFDSNGGSSVPNSLSIATEGTFTFPSPGSKSGYIFDGWSSDGGTTKFAAGSTSPAVTAAINYTAYWSAAPTLQSINITGTLSKTSYFTTDSWSPAGLTVTGTYDDESTAPISEGITWSYSPATPAAAGADYNGNLTITASVAGVSDASIVKTVTVNPVPPVPVTHTIEDLYSISTTGTSVLFNGVYMGHYGTNPFQAIWFADGEYAIAVYGTSTVPSTWEVGKTVVAVSAKTAFYNGLVQVNNASFQLTSATVDTPVVYDFTGTETTANQLSRKVSLSGTVTALSAAITKATDTTVTVTMDNGNAVKIFLKKNVFTDEQIAEYVDTFVVDQYVVVTGFLGYFKSGQTFGSAYNPGDFQVLCPTIVSTEKYTAEKFATDFTDATTPVCSRAESERLTGLQSIWSELSAKYSALDSTERANLVSAEASSNVKNAVARYDYICGKYNTSEHKVLEEFIEGATIVYNSLFVQLSNNNNNAMITTIVITSIASIALLGVTLFIKKRKATH